MLLLPASRVVPENMEAASTNGAPASKSSLNEMSETKEDTVSLTITRRIALIQLAVGLIASVGSIGPGMSLGYSAIALPPMTSLNGTMQMTTQQASWFASLAAISTPIGCLLSGVILDRLGRKVCLLLVNVPCIVGWVVIATVPHEGASIMTQLFIGRMLTGLSTGMTSIPGTMYLAEVAANPAFRSVLVTWTSVSIAGGVLVVYALGAIFQTDWRLVAGICALFPAASFLLTLFFLPESPVWLVSKSKQEQAFKSLKSLRGHTLKLHIQTEFDQMVSVHTKSKNCQDEITWKSNLRYLLRPEAWKPMLIMNAFFFFQQASGVFVVIFYAVDVVREAGVTIDEYLATILIGAMRFIVSIVVSFTSNKMGRRPTAILSGVGMASCMGILSLYLYLIEIEFLGPEMVTNVSWIPVTVLLLYIITSTFGFLTLPWAMLGEVYPARIRGIAGGTTTCLAYVFSFAVVKVYPDLLELMGKHGVFFFYGLMALVGTIFVIAFLPETLGKSALDMEEYFSLKVTYNQEKDAATINTTPLLSPETKSKITIVTRQVDANRST